MHLVVVRVIEAAVEREGVLDGEHAHGELELVVHQPCHVDVLHLPAVGDEHVLKH